MHKLHLDLPSWKLHAHFFPEPSKSLRICKQLNNRWFEPLLAQLPLARTRLPPQFSAGIYRQGSCVHPLRPAPLPSRTLCPCQRPSPPPPFPRDPPQGRTIAHPCQARLLAFRLTLADRNLIECGHVTSATTQQCSVAVHAAERESREARLSQSLTSRDRTHQATWTLFCCLMAHNCMSKTDPSTSMYVAISGSFVILL